MPLAKSSSPNSSDGSIESEAEKIIKSLVPRKKSSLESQVDRFFGDITKASAAKQVAVGGGTGWVTGYLAVKIGKSAAITLGATVLLFQVAQHKGIIKVNWTKVNRAVESAKESAQSFVGNMENDVVDTLKKFYNDNFFLATGFMGGFAAGVLF